MNLYLNEDLKQEIIAIHGDLLRKGELYPEGKLKEYLAIFQQKFGPETLASLDGEELLEVMHTHGNKNSLVYWLEFKDDQEFPAIFGGIDGGSALKFRIYRSKETGKWINAFDAMWFSWAAYYPKTELIK